VGFGKYKVSSIPDAVAKVLAEEFGYSLPKNQMNGDSNGNSTENMFENSNSENKNSHNSEGNNDFLSTGIMGSVDVCPECGNYSFVKEEGCAKCYSCGYSIC